MVELVIYEGRDIIVIFLTAHDEFVYMSFQYAPFRYIRKEYMEEELPSAMKAAVAKLSAQRSVSICLKMQDGELSVKIADITHFQIENRRVCAYMVQGGTHINSAIASVLGNLLDNAITARAKVSGSNVEVNIYMIKNNLCMKICNQTVSEQIDFAHTSASDKNR